MMEDTFGRTITYLRLSVTDLCNYRCCYCMAPEGVEKTAHGAVCSLEELRDMTAAAVACGVRKVRITAGALWNCAAWSRKFPVSRNCA